MQFVGQNEEEAFDNRILSRKKGDFMKGKKIQKWFLMGIFGVLMGLGITKPLCVKAQVVYPGKIEITEEGKKFKY